MIDKVKILKALVFVGLFFLSSCQKEEAYVHLTGRTMGTTYNVKFFGLKEHVKSFKPAIDQLLVNVNNEMSTYIKSSEISYFNNSARLSWVKVSQDFFNVTKYSLGLARLTDGLYDPTVGPLVNLWGFGPRGDKKVPSRSEIDSALSRVGFQKIELDKSSLRLKKTVPGVYLDLSSVAKGFGVDKIAGFLESQNIKSFMVEIGGEVRTKGLKFGGKPWNLAIESVDYGVERRVQRVLPLKDLSLATSGNYRNFFEKDGKKFSHTINPKTGASIPNELASVSVVAKTCMTADAMATALMVMGEEKALAFAEKQGVAAYFIILRDGPSGQEFVSVESSKFKELFPPSEAKASATKEKRGDK